MEADDIDCGCPSDRHDLYCKRCPLHLDQLCVGIAERDGRCAFACAIDNHDALAGDK